MTTRTHSAACESSPQHSRGRLTNGQVGQGGPTFSRSAARNCRVAALQNRWDRPRVGLDLILDQRGADMADLPGGASWLLRRGYKGKEPIDW